MKGHSKVSPLKALSKIFKQKGLESCLGDSKSHKRAATVCTMTLFDQ